MYLSGPDGPYIGRLPDPIPGAPIALTEEGAAFHARLLRIEEARREARGLLFPDMATWRPTEEPASGHRAFQKVRLTPPLPDTDGPESPDPGSV